MDLDSIHATYPYFWVSEALNSSNKRIGYRVTHEPSGLVSQKPVNTLEGALQLIEFFGKNRNSPTYWGPSDQLGDIAFD